MSAKQHSPEAGTGAALLTVWSLLEAGEVLSVWRTDQDGVGVTLFRLDAAGVCSVKREIPGVELRLAVAPGEMVAAVFVDATRALREVPRDRR